MKYIEASLKNLGFTTNEARVYLATLEVGVSSAQDIAEKAGIIRTTAYSILEHLAIRGVIIRTKKQNKNRYFAEAPKNLIRRFGTSITELEKSLPELQAIYNKSETKPKIVFYEGLEGISKIYQDTIRSNPDEILEFNTSEMFAHLPEDFPKEYVQQRLKNKISARRIAPDDSAWKKHSKQDNEELSKTILLNTKDFDIPVEINIYKNKVAFMSYSDRIGVIIEGDGIAKAMRTIYELVWKQY
jgi:sugar-specific transcriptional regulator TrmB